MSNSPTVFIHIPGGSFVATGSPSKIYDQLIHGDEVSAYALGVGRNDEGVVRLGPGFALTYAEKVAQ